MSDAGMIPRVAASTNSTRDNRTGSWKYIRPVYHDRVAPCNERCPVGIDIEGYMNLLREGRRDEAIDLLLAENPIPAVTGRVCDHPCETACNRCGLDDAVAVHAVERMLGDAALARPILPAPPRTREERIAVVGAGPAGLACAWHLARAGYAVTVFDEAEEPGGLLRQGIPEYRLPRDVLDRQIALIASQGVDFRSGVRFGPGSVPWSSLEEFDAVFLGLGAHRGRALGIEGEHLDGVMQGLAFLKEVNRGARPGIGERVVVIGGGNTAMDCARTALRLGAKPVVAYRRTREEMPAIPAEVEEAEREGIEFVFQAAPLKIRDRDGARVAGIELERMVPGEPDASGRRRPVPSGESFVLPADTVLTAIGEDPELDTLPPDVAHDGDAIRVDGLGATRLQALFAGGDAAGATRTVANALGAGKRSAIAIDRWFRRLAGDALEEEPESYRWGAGNISMSRWNGTDPVRRRDPVNEVVRDDAMNLVHYDFAPRHEDRIHENGGAPGFAEVNDGLTLEDAAAEAARCMNCAVCNSCELCLIFCPDAAISRAPDGYGFEIDYDHCKGCGVCAAECPRGAITMTRSGL